MRLFVSLLFSIPLFALTYPALPVATVDVTCCPAAVRTVAVHNAAQLQAAFNAAQLGDNIVLDAGATYEGNFRLSVPGGTSGWVTVSTTGAASLPPPGTRVGLKDASHMAKIISPGFGRSGDPAGSALGNKYEAADLKDLGVHHYRFIGIEFATGLTNTNYHVIWFSPMNSSGKASPASMPHHIIIDRCLIHGNDPITTKFPNGAAYLNGSAQFDVANGAIVDSYIYNLWGVGVETQAITCGGGPGPRLIQNNEISGGTEAFMCGGAILAYPDQIPTDITVVHNYFTRPVAWRASTPIIPFVKNMFELKVGKRVRLTDNVFENSWDRGGGQGGAIIVLTARNWQDSGDGAMRPVLMTNEVSDVLVASNVVRNAGSFVGTLQYDNYCISNSVTCIHSARYLISDNVADYDTAYFPSQGAIAMTDMQDFSVKRNTLLGHNTGGGKAAPATYGNRNKCSDKFGTNFEWSYNIFLNGVGGDCQSDPADILVSSWLGTVSVTSNVVANAGASLAAWQAFGHNSKIAASEAAIALAADELTMQPSSPYYGKGIGANLSCFNESAIRAGTPSALCPLPPEVQARPAGTKISALAGPKDPSPDAGVVAPASSIAASPVAQESDKVSADAKPVTAAAQTEPSSPAAGGEAAVATVSTNAPPAAQSKANGNSAKPAAAAAAKPASAAGESARYVLGPNDVVQVQVWDNKDLTAIYAIQPDGMMSMPLIEDFKAVGLTTVGLRDLITEKLREFIKNPEVTVQLMRNNSKKYTLIGGILKSGPYPLDRETTILDALALSGGFKDFANEKKIYLLRNGKKHFFNYKDVRDGKHMEQNIVIEDGDIIYVPE